MKKLFLLLVVVNLVIWLWGQRDRLTGVADLPQPDLGVIRLLDDAELAVRREPSRRELESGDTVAADARRAQSGPPGPAGDSLVAAPQPAMAEAVTAPPAPMTEPIGDPVPGTTAAPAAALSPVVSGRPEVVSPEPIATTHADAPATTPDAVSVLAHDASAPAEVPPASSVAWPHEESARDPTPITAAAADADAPAEPAVAVSGPAEPPPQPGVASALAEPAPAAAHADAQQARAEVARQPATESEPGMPAAREAAPVLVDAAGTGAAAASATGESVMIPDGGPPLAASAASEEPREPPPSRAILAARETPGTPIEAPPEPIYVCESLGPFADRAAAVRAQAAMMAPFRAAMVREERVVRAVRHWVLAPVQPSREATSEYLTRLGQAGVKDAWRIPNGPLAGRLAVGVFQSLENARKHADMLAAKGVEAEVLAPKDLDSNRAYWVDYERPTDAPPPLAASRAQPVQKIVKRACGRVAGP